MESSFDLFAMARAVTAAPSTDFLSTFDANSLSECGLQVEDSQSLTKKDFIESYVETRSPVVINGCMECWNLDRLSLSSLRYCSHFNRF